jgi:hypothetical protein
MAAIDPVALRGTLAHIEAHPDEWNQGRWGTRTTCGTTFCFAGWACVLAGQDDFEWSSDGDTFCLSDGEPMRSAARDILGLDINQACELFSSDRTLDSLKRIVARLCAEAEAP